MLKKENFMIINSETGEKEEIMGKYMYYSLPCMVLKLERVKEICEQIGFPIKPGEGISVTDAYRSATGGIYDRFEKIENDEKKVVRIYCRDNKRSDGNILSRELVEETLYESTNSYKKLANITLDKSNGVLSLVDINPSSSRNIYGYFEQAREMFNIYQNCIGNRSIETMAEKYISGLNAIKISARGHHYFVPKAYMNRIQLLEDFLELLAKENLFTYTNSRRDARYVSVNSMFVVDDEKQRRKMAHEFYQDMGREIEEYQKRLAGLIQSGNSSERILERWELKIQSLEGKKREYETILRNDLNGIDEEFTMLKGMCNQFKMGVKSTQILGLVA